jgi:hypothetical protein
MDRQAVSSSNIRSVGFDNGTLEIEFNRGGVYQYYNVPEGTFRSLISAPSVGKYFHAHIKDVYHFSKIS